MRRSTLREARDQGPFLGSVLKGNTSLFRLVGWAHKTIPQNHKAPRADGSDMEGRQLHAVLTLLPSTHDNGPRVSRSHNFLWVRGQSAKGPSPGSVPGCYRRGSREDGEERRLGPSREGKARKEVACGNFKAPHPRLLKR